MNRLTLFVLCSFFAFFWAAQANELSLVEIRKSNQDRVVSIGVSYLDLDGNEGCEYGSGSIISSDGYILTSMHLFKDSKNRRYKSMKIRGVVGEPYDCNDPIGNVRGITFIRAESDDIDAALVQMQTKDQLQPVKACRETLLEPGETLTVVGFPLNQRLSAKQGPLDSLNGPGGTIRVALEINEGHSGGPVFNRFGRLVGIIMGDIENANDFTFVVPVHLMLDLLEIKNAVVQCETLTGSETAEEVCLPIFKSYEISFTNDTHESFKASTKSYGQDFSAESGYRFSSYDWIPRSVNHSAGVTFNFKNDNRILSVATRLEAGPSFDRWRGWLHGIVETKQLPIGCG